MDEYMQKCLIRLFEDSREQCSSSWWKLGIDFHQEIISDWIWMLWIRAVGGYVAVIHQLPETCAKGNFINASTGNSCGTVVWCWYIADAELM